MLAKGQHPVLAMSLTIVGPMVEVEADNFLQFFAMFPTSCSHQPKKNIVAPS
jgi:hypothetical protein